MFFYRVILVKRRYIWDNQFKLIVSINLFLHTFFYRDVEPVKRDNTAKDLCEFNKSVSPYITASQHKNSSEWEGFCSCAVKGSDKKVLEDRNIWCRPEPENQSKVTSCKAVVLSWWTTEDDERNLNPWPLFIRRLFMDIFKTYL